MKVAFEVSLDGINYEGTKNKKKGIGVLSLKMGRRLLGGAKAKVEIEFESCDQPEVVARINDRIVSKLPF